MGQSTLPVEVFVGVDVGKSAHHAVAVDVEGRVLLDRALPQDEAKLRMLIVELRCHGSVLFVVDQPASVGALPLAVARDEGVLVGYLPGLAMRRIAEVHAGEAKTDARDAAVIAHAARTMPHALRPLRQDDEATAVLGMLAGFDEDLAGQVNQLSNRIRGLLTQIHPALERVVGPRLQHPAALEMLQRYPSPQSLRAAGRARVAAQPARRRDHGGARRADGCRHWHRRGRARAAAARLAARSRPRAAAAGGGRLEKLVGHHDVGSRLLTMPGVGFRTAARFVVETSSPQFRTPGHLAAFAGLAPVTPRSGTSVRGERAPRRGNRRLKRSLYLSAFAALQDPVSRANYDRKRAERKTHRGALLALARRRIDVLFAMLRDDADYDPKKARAA